MDKGGNGMQKHKSTIWIVTLVSSATALTLAGQALAADSDAPAANQGSALEEVVVTARRREENAQQVPIAITTISAAVLQDNNIATLQDVQQLVPAMTVTTGNVGQRDTANVAIRGQGYGSIAGQAAVAMYLNEVPIPTDQNGLLAGGPGLFFDLENVQVLKGPQGTLFGRNTMGGAVLLQTARPTDDFGGHLQVGYGNYNDRELDAAINLPIIDDKLLVRVAINGQLRDGFSFVQSMPGYPNGLDLDNRDYRSARVSVTYRPIDIVQNDTIVTYQEYANHGSADFLTYVDPKGLTASIYPTLLGLLAEQQALGARTHLPIDTDTNGTNGNLFALENITKVDINDQLTYKNIFGFHQLTFNIKGDVDGTALPIFEVVADNYHARQITDEMQLQGKSFGGHLDWVAGAFYSTQAPPGDTYSPLGVKVLQPEGTPADVVNSESQTRLTLESKALFAQGTYAFSGVLDGLKLTGGLRNTWDDRNEETPAAPGVPATALPSNSKALTWTGALDYPIAPDASAYFTSRRGYREGGASAAAINDATVLFPFGPEYVTDYEVGIKSDWKVADVPIRTNVDVYYQDYSDIQVTQIVPYPGQPAGLDITTNVGAARLWGAEYEGLVLLTKNLELGANFSYLSFKYTKFGPGVDGATLIGEETANRIPREYGLNARYYLPVPDTLGKLSALANWHWQAHFGDFLGTSQIPSYGLLNLSFNWDKINGSPFDAQVFCSNALNKTYISGGIGFVGFEESTYGDPRLYGIRVNYRFGAQAK
jgi:iron complex outermembrane recepter protein